MSSDTMSAEEIVRGRIDAIKARCEAATPGPWKIKENCAGSFVVHGEKESESYFAWMCSRTEPPADFEFIAHARRDIPYLLELVESQAAEIAELREKNAGLALALMFECKPNDDCLGDDEWGAIKAKVFALQAQLTASQQETRAAVGWAELLYENMPLASRTRDIRAGYVKWRDQQEAKPAPDGYDAYLIDALQAGATNPLTHEQYLKGPQEAGEEHHG